MPAVDPEVAGRITQAVIDLIESEGVDDIQLGDVARRARVSLSTIYKAFAPADRAGLRAALVFAAVEEWMSVNVYSRLTNPPYDDPWPDALVWLYRQLFEPWEANPNLAAAFIQARIGVRGARLEVQGQDAAEPIARRIVNGLEPAQRDAVLLMLDHVVHSMFFRVATGQVPVAAIRPAMEDTIRRLAAGRTARGRLRA